jgi:hypothetical protein
MQRLRTKSRGLECRLLANKETTNYVTRFVSRIGPRLIANGVARPNCSHKGHKKPSCECGK